MSQSFDPSRLPSPYLAEDISRTSLWVAVRHIAASQYRPAAGTGLLIVGGGPKEGRAC